MELAVKTKRRYSPTTIDLTGQRFGRLVVLHRDGKRKNGNAAWLCQCDCGNRVTVDSYAMRHGSVRSCGCLRRDNLRRLAETNPAFMDMQQRGAAALQDQHGVSYASLHRGKRNRSGVIGVSYDRATGRWCARLRYHGKYVLLKMFARFSDAVAARQAAEKQYLGR